MLVCMLWCYKSPYRTFDCLTLSHIPGLGEEAIFREYTLNLITFSVRYELYYALHFILSLFLLGSTAKHSFGQWIRRLGIICCWTSFETSTTELLGFLVFQERQNQRLAWEPESGYNFRHGRRFLGV